MSAAGLAAAIVGGLAAGRLSAAVADRYGPPRPGRRRIPVTEVVTAAAWLGVVHRFGVGWAAAPPLVAATSLVALSVIDLRVYRLPDAITLPALAASIVAVVGASVALGRPGAIVSALAVGGGYGAILWGAHELHPRGLGFGDVKLAPMLGVHVGWVAGALYSGWSPVLGLAAQALLLSSLIGLAMGLALGVLRSRGFGALLDPSSGAERSGGSRLLDTGFPFGPALAAGTMTAVLFSEVLIG